VLYPGLTGLATGSGPSRTALRTDVDDVEHATAIHGLVRWRPFRIDSVNQNRCVLTLLLHPTPDYRFSPRSAWLPPRFARTHGDDYLTNRDDVPIPFGVGFHPYLRSRRPPSRGPN